MTALGAYNGFTGKQREQHYRELKRLLAFKLLAPPIGPCDLCGDPGSSEPTAFEYHTEDYSLPVKFGAPAMYCLCRICHRDKLHKRFRNNADWFVFMAHVRRGGYAREINLLPVRNELKKFRKSIGSGSLMQLVELRDCALRPGHEWFSRLGLKLAESK